MLDNLLWVHSGGNESRIDFVAVGGQVDINTAASSVAVSVDLMTPNMDHWGVQLQVHAVFRGGPIGTGRVKRARYDRQKIITDEGRVLLKKALQQLPPAEWDTHPDVHAKRIEQQLKDILEANFPFQINGPRASYIDKQIKMRQKYRGWPRELLRIRKATALQIWRLGTGVISVIVRKMNLLGELMRTAMGFCTAWMKRRIKQSKKGALANFLKYLGEMRPQQLLKALNHFGIGGKTRKRGRPASTTQSQKQGWTTAMQPRGLGPTMD